MCFFDSVEMRQNWFGGKFSQWSFVMDIVIQSDSIVDELLKLLSLN